MGRGFFPLDEELGLLPGSLTPSMVEDLALLGSWAPFGQAAKLVGHFRKVEVSEATARRATEKSGRVYVELQTEEVEGLEAEMREAPSGPALQQLSVDGAMVPLLHGEWGEVKTLVIGTIEGAIEGAIDEPALEGEAHARDLSYFSRMADHQSFGRLAAVETHRRGTETAGKVCAVVDGAEWQQGFIDLHRPDAVRILDWCHGAEHLSKAGQAAFGAGTAAASEWLGVQLHQLKQGEPEEVLRSLRALCRDMAPGQGTGDGAFKTVKGSLEYLEKRRAQIRYAEFRAQGYPIGSGAVESANKLVVEARLKGSGMHWAREHVNPMAALRTVVCNGRWEEVWPRISRRLGKRSQARSGRHRLGKDPEKLPVQRGAPQVEDTTMPGEAATGSTGTPAPLPSQPLPSQPLPSQPNLGGQPKANSAKACQRPANGHRRPAADHPWRRMTIGRKPLSPNPTPHPRAKI